MYDISNGKTQVIIKKLLKQFRNNREKRIRPISILKNTIRQSLKLNYSAPAKSKNHYAGDHYEPAIQSIKNPSI